ncbi:569_t:CDS:10, partial [Dentiscutata erythropus]
VRQWKVDQVSNWLQENSFREYQKLFAENDINGDVLLELDHEILKELKIRSIGDRLRLLNAVRTLLKICAGNNLPYHSIVKYAKVCFLIFVYSSYTFPISLSRSNSNVRSRTRSNSTNRGYSPSLPSQQEILVIPIESIKQAILSTIKVYGEEGQTRTISLNNIVDAESILKRILQKFNINEDVENYSLFANLSDIGETRSLSDEEIVEICRSSDRPERERLTLRKKHLLKMSYENSKKQKKDLEKFFGERPPDGPQVGVSKKKLRDFFGQRPPSELIQLNLTEYFPGHNSEELERSVARNSIYRNSIYRNTIYRRASRVSSASKLSIQKSKRTSKLDDDNNSIRSKRTSKLDDDYNSIRSKRTSKLDDDYNSVMSKRTSKLDDDYDSIISKPTSKLDDDYDSIISKRTSKLDDDYDSTISKRTSKLDDDYNDYNSDRSKRTSEFDDGYNNDRSNTVTVSNYGDDRLSILMETSISSDTTIQEQQEESSDTTIQEQQEEDGDYFQDFDYEDEEDLVSDPEIIDVDHFSKKWIKGNFIGMGSFGSVYLGLNAFTGELMAVKQVELPTENSSNNERKKTMLDALQREITLLEELQHENIVQYLGSQYEEGTFNIFLEYVPGGSVATMLNNYGPLEEPLIRSFVRQILQGLNYLHEKDIIHRDIKGANVLVDNKGIIKISDFGISKKVED